VETALADIGERLNQGQPEALEDCYRTLGPLVMSYLARYVPQPDIEDVMQRVFYEVWRVHERYDPNLSLRGWGLGIARKRAIDHLRKRRYTQTQIAAALDIALGTVKTRTSRGLQRMAGLLENTRENS